MPELFVMLYEGLFSIRVMYRYVSPKSKFV